MGVPLAETRGIAEVLQPGVEGKRDSRVIALGTPHRLCQPVLKTCFLNRKFSSPGLVGDAPAV